MRRLFPLFIATLLVLQARAITVQIYQEEQTVCTYSIGALFAGISGGTPPYTILWSTGATTPVITGLPAGPYSVTVTDDLGEQATANYTLTAMPLFGGAIGLPNCLGGIVGPEFRMIGPGGVYSIGQAPITINGPYQVDHFSGALPGEQGIYIQATANWPPPGTAVSLPFTDATGCAGTMEFTIPSPMAYPEVQILSVEPACPGSGYGSVTIQTSVSPNQDMYHIELIQGNTNYGPINVVNSFGQQPQTATLSTLAPGDYGLRIYPKFPPNFEWMEYYFAIGQPGSCSDTVWFNVPAMAEPCATLRGTVYMDDDQNCVMAANEVKVPQSVITVEPGGYTALTAGNGYYELNLPTGSYTMTQTAPDVAEHCFGGPIAVNLPVNGQTLTQNIGDTALVGRDVEIAMSSGFARPGFAYPGWINVENNTPGSTGTVTISCTFDPVLAYTSASPTPTNVSGNTITWALSQINSFGSRGVSMQFMVPPNPALLGTDLQFTATVGIVQPELNLANNTTAHSRTVTGSYDPNDKTALTSSRESTEIYFIEGDDWIDHTIRFQNTGTDTAFNVVITDTLPPTLDPATFDLLLWSHPCTPQLTGQGVLRFLFPNIQLPDSNVNELRSHGLVQFRTRPKQPVLPGTIIENIANIYFDFNPPIITEPSVLVAEFSTGVADRHQDAMRLYPNPATDRIFAPCPECGTAPYSVTIQAVDGKVVLQATLTSETEGIDISTLASGAYLLRAIGTRGNSTASFIKGSRP